MSQEHAIRTRLEWAPDIPPDWDVVNLKMLARIFAGGTPDRKNTDYWTDGTVPWLNSGSVNDWAISTPSELISPTALTNGATRWAPRASVLVALAGQGKTKGMAARLEIDSTLNQSLAAIVPGSSLDYRFLQYWLTSNYQNIRGLAGGDLRDGLNLQHIGSIQVPRPPVGEQRAIADYLDRETAQIDAFITKNEELITLLTERRASSIAEQIGKYETIPLKRLVSPNRPLTYGILQVGEPVEQGVPYLLPVDFVGEGASPQLSSLLQTTPEIAAPYSRAIVRSGDIVITIGPGYGRVGLVTPELDGVFLTRDTVRIAPISTKVSSGYLMWALSSRVASDFWDRTILGSTFRRLNVGTLGDTAIPLPPLGEQARIVERIADIVARADFAITTAQRSVSFARERRAALISAAVTGKIDVGVAV